MTMNCHHASARSVVRTGSAPTRWTSTASRITPARRSSRLRNLMIEVEAVDRTIIPPRAGPPGSPEPARTRKERGMGLLDKKVAVVTGAGSGIGRAVALGLAAERASVVVGDYGVSVDGRDPSSAPAAAVVREIEKAGGRALASAENVATMAGGKAMVDAALKSFGDLHVVVCCAGILRERMIFNMTEEEWDAVVAVHLKGHFTVMRPASAHMREKKYGR